jgi:hypothetical protein
MATARHFKSKASFKRWKSYILDNDIPHGKRNTIVYINGRRMTMAEAEKQVGLDSRISSMKYNNEVPHFKSYAEFDRWYKKNRINKKKYVIIHGRRMMVKTALSG